VYTIRDVIKQHYRDLVEGEIPYQSTEKEYISSYQRAVTSIYNNMTEDELAEAENIMMAWNKLGAPQDVQLK